MSLVGRHKNYPRCNVKLAATFQNWDNAQVALTRDQCLITTQTLVFGPKWSLQGLFQDAEETPHIRAPWRRAGTLKVRTRPTST